MSVSKTRPAVPEDAPADNAHAPRVLTLTENIVLTVKVLAGAGLIGAGLWAASFWTAAK
jgi:hypothetical protein